MPPGIGHCLFRLIVCLDCLLRMTFEMFLAEFCVSSWARTTCSMTRLHPRRVRAFGKFAQVVEDSQLAARVPHGLLKGKGHREMGLALMERDGQVLKLPDGDRAAHALCDLRFPGGLG